MKAAIPQPKESEIQKACIDLLTQLGIFSYKINNVGIKKANGSYIPAQTKGLPDLVIHSPRGKVTYIEFKRPDGVLSEGQILFQKQCELDEIPYWVIRSVDGLISKINSKRA